MIIFGFIKKTIISSVISLLFALLLSFLLSQSSYADVVIKPSAFGDGSFQSPGFYLKCTDANSYNIFFSTSDPVRGFSPQACTNAGMNLCRGDSGNTGNVICGNAICNAKCTNDSTISYTFNGSTSPITCAANTHCENVWGSCAQCTPQAEAPPVDTKPTTAQMTIAIHVIPNGVKYTQIDVGLHVDGDQMGHLTQLLADGYNDTYGFDFTGEVGKVYTFSTAVYDGAGTPALVGSGDIGNTAHQSLPTSGATYTGNITIPAAKTEPGKETGTCETVGVVNSNFKCQTTCTAPWSEKTPSQTGNFTCSTLGTFCCKDPSKGDSTLKPPVSTSTTPAPGGASTSPVVPTPTTLPDSTDPCATHGGIKYGTGPVAMCGGKPYDATEASKPSASNPYCGKKYQSQYSCADGTTSDPVDLSDQTVCGKSPWCGSSESTTPGAQKGEACPNAAGTVNGNCPDTTPLCNNPSGITPECVTQASKNTGQYCSKDLVCSTNNCSSTSAGLPKTCNPPTSSTKPAPSTGPAPTAASLPTSDYCPLVDTDGRPNSCWDNPTTGPVGYSLKSTSSTSPGNVSCSQHSQGYNPWCWHKDASTSPTPTPAAKLSEDCPVVDTDNKTNTCSLVADGCTVGFTHDPIRAQADQDCSTARQAPAYCCHSK